MRLRRPWALLVVLCLLVTSVAAGTIGCAAPASTPEATAPSGDEPADSSSTPAAPADEVFEWKLQSSWTGIGITQQDEACRRFVERTKEMSNGRLLITNYDADVLVGANECYQAIADGVVDMAVASPNFFGGVEPVGMQMWQVPFLTEHEEFYDMIYYELGGKELWREVYAKHNIFALNYMLSDEWGSMASRVPINHLSDVEGLKIRTTGLHGKLMQEFGAGVTMFPPVEMYSAFSTGVIDAAVFGSPNGWLGLKIYEVAPYYIDPPMVPYDINETIVSMDSWNSLPNDLKAILEASSRIHSSDWAALSMPVDAAARTLLKDAGMTFCVLPDDEIIQAKDRCYELFEETKEIDSYSARYYDIVMEALKIKAEFYGPRQIPT
ncbi:MAG: TRAP transporter substrate-binding protein DctP [Dehalococcoidia bacterium]|nr:TRAP transporter substrate-binding protein DctP [Dehalococcoidia bacterium]